MRLDKTTIGEFKQAMESFLPHYINFDAHLPKHYEYHFSMLEGLVSWGITWSNVTYSEATLDVKDTNVDLVVD